MSSTRARAIKALSAVGIAFLMVWSTVSVFSVATPEERAMYIVELEDDTSPEVFRMIGTNVLVDYGNGIYVVDASESQLFSLKSFDLRIEPSANYRTLDLYPSDVVFDTAKGIPAAPSAMRGLGWDQETYIVQFIGPYAPSWLEKVEEMGASNGKLVQSYSVVVKMSPDVKSRVSALPFVCWVGAYQPWYKLSSELLDVEGGLRVEIVAFDDSMKDSLSTELVDLGASVMMTYSPGTVVAYLDSQLLPWVASLPEVTEIYESGIVDTLDIVAAEIHRAFEAWYPIRSGLPSSLTGRSPGPDGLDYTADDFYEVVGIQDSGFDISNEDQGHPDFFMGPVGDRVKRYTPRTPQSVQYDGFVSGTAHGTHVAGDAAGNGFSWEDANGYPTNDADWEKSEGVGMAPEAKLSLDGVQGLGGLAADPANWDAQYLDGAHVYSNSYGRPPADYGGSSPAADLRTNQANNRLIVFAASNEGPDLNTLGPGSQAKNGITAGASLNFRPDWFQADNPNIMTDFSSRGGVNQSYGRLKPDMVTVGTASIAPMGVGEWDHNEAVGIANPQPSYIMTVDVYNHDNPPVLDGDGINDYRYMDGTSVASPHMAGLTLLVREYLREYAGYTDAYAINSQLVKGLMINGAVRMDEALYDYPGYDQGWGRADLMQSLFPPVPRTNRWEEGTMSAPGSWNPSFGTSVQSDEVPLKVTLTWVDSMGKDLFRDLDLIVTSPSGDTYVGNVYGTVGQSDGWSIPNPGVTDSNPVWDRDGNTYDDLNNVEQVEVQFPEVGAWQIQVLGRSLPAPAPFAVVVSADFGPQTEHKIDIDTDYPLSLEITMGGQVFLPFTITNFGTNVDSVFLSKTGPGGINFDFESVIFTDLQPRETISTWVMISVESTFPDCGIQDLKITAQSLGDPSVLDQLEIRLAITCTAVVTPMQLTFEEVDELDPSVLTFNNGTADHIFIAYRKTNPVGADPKFGGPNVYVAHTTLDSIGMPVLPFNHTIVSNWNDDPNDLRWTYIPSTANKSNRVILTWTGDDPEVPLPLEDYDSYGVLSYSDPPYDVWNRVVIERNAGSSVMNEARMNIPLWRDDGTPDGEVIWVWEHLDYISPEAPSPLRVQTHAAISRDGGETWPVCDGSDNDCKRISPFDNNYYFFPNACIDTREVLWVFFYYRLPAGDDRDLMVRLYDKDGWMGEKTPINPKDDVSLLWNTKNTNLQWPACVATSEGSAGNRMYVVVTNDEGLVDLKLYVAYLDGLYNTTNRPFGLNTTEESGISPNLHGPYGPLGGAVSNSNYDRRPILNVVHTNDGWTWIAYIENQNEFNEPNLWSYSSDVGFNYAVYPDDVPVSKLTADPFAKGHQMTDTLTVSGIYHNVYEVYHASKGTVTDVNYDVYLLIYHKDWESDPDTTGPLVDPIVAIPNPYDVSIDGNELQIYATVSDTTTGMSNVTAAEWKEVPLNVTDPLDIDWTGALPMTIETNSPTEVGEATHIPTTWDGGETHRMCARGMDMHNNWGVGACVDVLTIGKKPEFRWFNLTFNSAGWYLISLPVSLINKTVENTFSSISNFYDQVRVYDTQTDEWLSYMTFKVVNSLSEVDKTMGIWIHMIGGETLRLSGLVAYVTEIQLYPGWNLIGYPSLNATGMTVGDLLGNSAIDAVEGFDGMNSPYFLRKILDPSEYLQPGEGYWVHVNGGPIRLQIPGF